MIEDFELTVTICSWNTKIQTQKCLECLEQSLKETQFEVIVVDNGSTDGSSDMIAAKFPWVNLIRSPINLGFTAGHNHAIQLRKGKDVLLLNSDAYVHPRAIVNLVQFRKQNPQIGIIGPKLLNPDGSLQYSCRAFPNPIAALFRNSLIGKLFPHSRSLTHYLMMDWDHNSQKSVDWISGAAFYVTQEVIEKVGVLDENYFMYCEDVDWCWRAHRSGFDVVYFPDSVVTHEIGTSSSKAVYRAIIRFHRSMFRFYRVNMLKAVKNPLRSICIGFAGTALSMRAGLLIVRTFVTTLFHVVTGQARNKSKESN